MPVSAHSSAQVSRTKRISKDNRRRGDLVFFYGRGGVYHVAIFMRWDNGRALMVHSPGSGRSVSATRYSGITQAGIARRLLAGTDGPLLAPVGRK